jgi:CBS domain-containing protein
MKIKDVMTQALWTLPIGDTLNDALKLMWQHDVGALPVVDHNGHVMGMITDRDIAMATYLRGRMPAEIPVSETMSGEIVACHGDDTIADAERLMRDHQIRRLPVTDDTGHVIGMITLGDLARAATSGMWKVVASSLVRTFSSVAEPRQTEFSTVD